MPRRNFTSRELYALRNDIDIRILIEKALGIPCGVTEGCFRFLCPVCNGSDTAVHPKTNLARCFRCEKNFNTIDLVMLVRDAGFVESVKFLQAIHTKTFELNPFLKTTPSQRKPNETPCQIGKVIESVLPSILDDVPKKELSENKTNESIGAHQKADDKRIIKIEKQLEYLCRRIEKMALTINSIFPSK